MRAYADMVFSTAFRFMHTEADLERLIDRALRELPAARAPRSLEARVLARPDAQQGHCS